MTTGHGQAMQSESSSIPLKHLLKRVIGRCFALSVRMTCRRPVKYEQVVLLKGWLAGILSVWDLGEQMVQILQYIRMRESDCETVIWKVVVWLP